MSGLLAVLPHLIGSQPHPGLLLLLEAPDGIAGASFWPAQALADTDWVGEARSVRVRATKAGASRGILLACRLDPGLLDVEEVAAALAEGVELHHVLTLTEEHWWAARCDFGCCDGAVHPRPDVDADDVALDREGREAGLRQAWQRISEVHARAGVSAHRARLADLALVLEGLRDPDTRDIVLYALTPELVVDHREGPACSRPVTSDDLRAWGAFVPDEHEGAWLACQALALWREADTHRAAEVAATASALSGTSLARLMCDILRAGMTYEDAVSRSRR